MSPNQPTEADFSVGIQPKEAKALQDFLKQQGYITQASDSIRRGPRTTLVAVSSGPDYNKMLNDLFDPLMYISHLVSLFSCVLERTNADVFAVPAPWWANSRKDWPHGTNTTSTRAHHAATGNTSSTTPQEETYSDSRLGSRPPQFGHAVQDAHQVPRAARLIKQTQS